MARFLFRHPLGCLGEVQEQEESALEAEDKKTGH